MKILVNDEAKMTDSRRLFHNQGRSLVLEVALYAHHALIFSHENRFRQHPIINRKNE